MRICCALLVATSLMVALGCGAGDGSATSAETSTEQGAASKPASVERKARYPVPHLPSQRDPLETLVVKDVKVGNGPGAQWGDKAVVHYVGLHYDTGKIYSENWEGSWTFKLDGETIGPGWQKGVHGMRVGGRREIFIPARLIFDGADGDIAYVLELLEVKPGGPGGSKSSSSADFYEQEGPFAAITMRDGKQKPKIDSPERPPPKRLLTRDLKVGRGPAAREGDEVRVYYAGAIYETGNVKFYGWRPSSPVGVELGSGFFGRAWERGIEGMRTGGRRELILPSRFIGGSPAVDYLIEMVGFEPAAKKP